MALVGLNYWHAMRCVPAEAAVSSDATDIHIASLERRLLASEAEVSRIILNIVMLFSVFVLISTAFCLRRILKWRWF